MRLILTLILTAALMGAAPSQAARPKKKAPARKEAIRTSSAVKKDQKKNAREISLTKEQISRNSAETRRQLNRLSALEHEISRQKSLIEVLQERADSVRGRISAMEDTVAAASVRVERLRESYRNSLRSLHDRRIGVSPIAFIFASESFSQAVARTRYLKELAGHLSEKRRRLMAEIDSLNSRRATLDELRAALDTRLKRLDSERLSLEARSKTAGMTVDSLKRNGSALQKVLSDKQKLARKLDQELDRVIAEEIRRAEEQRKAEERRRAEEQRKAEERRRANEQRHTSDKGNAPAPATKPQPATKPDRTPERDAGEVRRLSGNFAANRGRLPMPVSGKYRIIGSFGRSAHSSLSRIEVQNNGIDIACAPGTRARAVFAGTVTSIFRLDGFQNIVIIRHSEYLTVYAGIQTLAVKKGQEVTAGQDLGVIYADPAETPQEAVLHFEVRREKEKLNPADWIR